MNYLLQNRTKKQRIKNKISLPPNKRYCLTPLARHKTRIDLGIIVFGMQFFNCTLVILRRFFGFINDQTPRQEIKIFTRGNWFLNNIKKIGVNTYCFEIFIFFTRRFTLILRNVNKLGSLSRRNILSSFSEGKSGARVGNNIL